MTNKTNIADFVKTAPIHLLEVLSHKVRCEHYIPFILHRNVTDYCKHEITMLVNRQGRSHTYPICERKYKIFIARVEGYK